MTVITRKEVPFPETRGWHYGKPYHLVQDLPIRPILVIETKPEVKVPVVMHEIKGQWVYASGFRWFGPVPECQEEK